MPGNNLPNQAASMVAPTAFLFAVVRCGRRATEQQRWLE
jgi:hypothetical protein